MELFRKFITFENWYEQIHDNLARKLSWIISFAKDCVKFFVLFFSIGGNTTAYDTFFKSEWMFPENIKLVLENLLKMFRKFLLTKVLLKYFWIASDDLLMTGDLEKMKVASVIVNTNVGNLSFPEACSKSS